MRLPNGSSTYHWGWPGTSSARRVGGRRRRVAGTARRGGRRRGRDGPCGPGGSPPPPRGGASWPRPRTSSHPGRRAPVAWAPAGCRATRQRRPRPGLRPPARVAWPAARGRCPAPDAVGGHLPPRSRRHRSARSPACPPVPACPAGRVAGDGPRGPRPDGCAARRGRRSRPRSVPRARGRLAQDRRPSASTSARAAAAERTCSQRATEASCPTAAAVCGRRTRRLPGPGCRHHLDQAATGGKDNAAGRARRRTRGPPAGPGRHRRRRATGRGRRDG